MKGDDHMIRRVSRMPSFGELPIKAKADTYIPGEYTPLPRFSLTTEKESQMAIRPETTWTKPWVTPKAVSRIGGSKLVTYKRDEFRKLNKEKIFKKLAIIPSPTLEPELQSFNGTPFGNSRTLGQTSETQTETGAWGNLVSALVTGATKYIELEKGPATPPPAPSMVPAQASILPSTSSLLPIAIMGGIAWMIFGRKKTIKFKAKK
jgi:hypothetical protein